MPFLVNFMQFDFFMKLLIKIIFIGLSLFMVPDVFGQGIINENLREAKINVTSSDTLLVGLSRGQKNYRFKGNVTFGHGDVAFYCDSAYQYAGQNSMEAFSNVKISRANSLRIMGDHLIYNGDRRMVIMTGNVSFTNGTRVKKSNYVKHKLKLR
jgi:hypothetical protein